MKNNKALEVFGVDKSLTHLCEAIKELKKSLSEDAKVYGSENCPE